jgi:Common central domain of tyrosinase
MYGATESTENGRADDSIERGGSFEEPIEVVASGGDSVIDDTSASDDPRTDVVSVTADAIIASITSSSSSNTSTGPESGASASTPLLSSERDGHIDVRRGSKGLPTSETNDGGKRDSSWLPSRSVSLTVAILLSVAMFVVSFHGVLFRSYQSDDDGITTTDIDVGGFTDDGQLVTDSVDVDDGETGAFSVTLKRTGYDTLSYFSADASSFLKYQFLDGYGAVVEPYVETELVVTGTAPDGVSYYLYSVCPFESPGSTCVRGTKHVEESDFSSDQTIIVACNPDDKVVYQLNVKAYDVDGNGLTSQTAYALCVYVRREIRSLTEADLDTLMDTMYVLWETNDKEGAKLYGENYKSSAYLVNLHHFNAAQQESDHIHEGNGYLMQHIKMTNIFEKSIQAVNPAVTLPYWDFTIERAEDRSMVDSYIMQESIFGNMTQPAHMASGFTYKSDLMADGAIPNGRWAYIEAGLNDRYDDLKQGYGYMRAPWNLNPSPYVSRFAYDYDIGIVLPSCTSHYSILQETNMMTFFNSIAYSPHSTTHSLAGGIYGCDKMQTMLDMGYIEDLSNMLHICSQWTFYLKEFYRYNNIVPRQDCVVEDDFESSTCGFDCLNSTMDNMITNLKAKLTRYVPSDIDDDGWYAWADFVCEGDGAKIFGGDHIESSSPADPSFWVIHPTLERLLHAKLMSGGFDDETW